MHFIGALFCHVRGSWVGGDESAEDNMLVVHPLSLSADFNIQSNIPCFLPPMNIVSHHYLNKVLLLSFLSLASLAQFELKLCSAKQKSLRKWCSWRVSYKSNRLALRDSNWNSLWGSMHEDFVVFVSFTFQFLAKVDGTLFGVDRMRKVCAVCFLVNGNRYQLEEVLNKL